MERKTKLIGTFLILLLGMGFLGFLDSIVVVSAVPNMAVAEYDYHVVAGYNMTPTLPPTAPQPDNFTFTLEGFAEGTSTGGLLQSVGIGGYDFGNLTRHGDRLYLTAGTDISIPTGQNWNAYVVANITNNLGYTITIEDLTAEVTSGTAKGHGLPATSESPADTMLFPISGENIANNTVIVVDTLDPWDDNQLDEVVYNQSTAENGVYHPGVVDCLREDGYPDHFRGTSGTIRPASMGRGPGSLLMPDRNGDALSTGHVATKYGGSPITLAAGANFTEYFAVCVLGDVAMYTQINATITLRMYYSPPPAGTAALVNVEINNLQPRFPAFVDDTVYLYPEWAGLNFNLTLSNLGNVPIDVTAGLYYSVDNETTWTQIGTSQNVLNLDITNGTLLNWVWNVKAASVPVGWIYLKANCTASSASDPAPDATAAFNIRMRVGLTGNADFDDDVDVGDQRKTQLAMFTSYPSAAYISWQNRAAKGPQIFTDFDGDLDVDVGDQRKQQLNMFKTDPTWPQH